VVALPPAIPTYPAVGVTSTRSSSDETDHFESNAFTKMVVYLCAKNQRGTTYAGSKRMLVRV
jgi:hypothetical protein